MSKRKVLICGDSSFVSSGLGIYNRELISRIQQDGRLEVAEMANYGIVEDKSRAKWKYYPTGVSQNDSRYQKYISSNQNQYGAHRFDSILLHFKPDIVACCMDPYMFEYQAYSPYRRYFNWNVATTLDSYPERPNYVHLLDSADNVFTYTDWGHNIITHEDYKLRNVRGVIPMGISDTFCVPENKIVAKQKLGFHEHNFVISTVMRNQERKLIPNLLEAFSYFLEIYGDNRLEEPVLVIHTTYPDIGWDIPIYLNRYKNLHNKVFFTYTNKEGQITPFLYKGASFGDWTFRSVNSGPSEKELLKLYHATDLYVQYASAEGFGLPMYEAAKCGARVAAVDYASMQEFIDKFDSDSIPVMYWQQNPIMQYNRACPDYKSLGQIIINHIYSDNINKIWYENVDAITEEYSWNNCASLWIDHFLNLELKDKQGQWDSDMEKIAVPQNPPLNLDNPNFVRWLYDNVTPFVDHSHGYFSLYNLECLEKGYVQNYASRIPIDQHQLFLRFATSAYHYNELEEQRANGFIPEEDYLQ